jgi:hypothetical protein
VRDEQAKQPSDADDELEREILHGRKFTLEEAVARMAGPGAMKGESPVTRLRQCELEIESWLGAHLADAGGALRAVLHRRVSGSELLLESSEHPLAVLASYCQQLLGSDYLLKEFVREADCERGRAMDERPYFDKAKPGHPDDPYTVDSVRNTLLGLLNHLTLGMSPT